MTSRTARGKAGWPQRDLQLFLVPRPTTSLFQAPCAPACPYTETSLARGEEGRDGDVEATVCGRTISANYVHVLNPNVFLAACVAYVFDSWRGLANEGRKGARGDLS